MNLNHLQYLAVVEKSGSINRAARELFVSQPYLSGVIRSIEEEMGFQIFQRTTTGVALTETGNEFMERAHRILREMDEMRKLQDHRIRGLRVVSQYSPFFMRCFLEMRDKYGGTDEDSFQEMSSEECFRALEAQNANIAFVTYIDSAKSRYQSHAASFHCCLKEIFSNVPFQVIMRPEHPLADRAEVTSEELMKFPFVFYNDVSAVALLKRIGISGHPQIVWVSDRGSCFDMVQGGDYLSLIAVVGKQPVKREVHYVPLADTLQGLNFAYSVRKDYLISRREKVFLEFVQESGVTGQTKVPERQRT